MEQQTMAIHSRKQQAILWLLSATVIATGAYLSSLNFLGEEWLSRAGCLVVVLGIWSGIGGILQERVLSGRHQLRHRLAVSRAKRNLRKQKADSERISAELETINKSFEEQLQAISAELRLSVGILEVSLLITGTLLWGFGDLVNFQ